MVTTGEAAKSVVAKSVAATNVAVAPEILLTRRARIKGSKYALNYDSQVIGAEPRVRLASRGEAASASSADSADPAAFNRTEQFAFLLLLAGVVVFPFPYGGITPLGICIIETVAFTILALTFFANPDLSRLRGAGLPILALGAIALLGVAQIIPLPVALLARLSPTSARIYADAAATLALLGHGAPSARISIAPTETAGTILLTLAYLALFVSSILLLRSRRKRRLFAAALLGGGAIHVIGTTVFRAFTTDSEDRLHGAFVNPNHLAGYLGILLAVAFAVLWREVLHARDDAPQRIERAARFEFRFLRLSTRALLWGLFLAALASTKSRGGIVVAVVTTCILIAASLLHPRTHKERWAFGIVGGATLAAALGFVLLAVRQQPILRFLASDPRDPASDLRLTLWKLSLEAWRPFPILGSGLGTFRESFRRIQPRDLPYLVEFAHSDSLQLLATGGLLALTLAVLAFTVLAARLLRRWWREPRREESTFALSGLAALLAITLHGLVEFNLSIPAIPATLAAVLGLAWAATQGEADRGKRQVEVLPVIPVP